MKTSAASKAPKVSVLVPIYNVEKYLRQCLDSLVGQTLRDIEIICINDGSTDSSPEIIKEYADKDDRIVVITKKNSGYGDSMNKGLAKARGEYIGILESDDFLELNAFEQLYGLAKEYDADVVRANYFHHKGGKDTLYAYVDPIDTNRLIDPLQRTWIFYQAPAIWSAIYRREFLLEHKINFLPTPGASYQDTGFNFKVWANTKKAVFTDAAFLHYRLDNENSSVNNPGKVFCVCDEWHEIEDYLHKHKLYEKYGELMQMAKFSAYWWNLERLAPELGREFLPKFQDEFKRSKEDGDCNQRLFTPGAWDNLKLVVNSDAETILKTVRRARKNKLTRQRIKNGLRKIYMKARPTYRKQVELSQLINDLELENWQLSKRIKQLEEERSNGKE